MATFTKQAIKSTFLKLLREKPLNQISVKTIVENCGINRKSFYYYYQDLPDLIDEIVSEQVDLLVTNGRKVLARRRAKGRKALSALRGSPAVRPPDR